MDRDNKDDEKEDDIFGFNTSKKISEEALQKLRKQNELNAREALRKLREGDDERLPRIKRSERKGPLKQSTATKRKKSESFRSNTPSEVRSAAKREISMLDMQNTIFQSRMTSSLEDVMVTTQDPTEQSFQPETEAVLKLLDWQKDCRRRGLDVLPVLTADCMSLFDKEASLMKHVLKKHNAILKDYMSKGEAKKDSDANPNSTKKGENTTNGEEKKLSGVKKFQVKVLQDEAISLRKQCLQAAKLGGIRRFSTANSDKGFLFLDVNSSSIPQKYKTLLGVLASLLEPGSNTEAKNQSDEQDGSKYLDKDEMLVKKMMIEMSAKGAKDGKKRPKSSKKRRKLSKASKYSKNSGSFDSLSDTESKTERDNMDSDFEGVLSRIHANYADKIRNLPSERTSLEARLEQLKKKNEFLLQGSQGFQGRGNGSPYKQPARVKATGRKEEERGDMQELSDGVVNSDWIQHVLPEISESSEDENPRLHEASAKLAGHLAKFRDEERFKERLKEGESLLHNIKSMTEMLHKTAGGEQVGMAQEQIAKEVKKLRKHVVDEVKGIYKDISRARDLLLNASDADTDTLRKDAQRLVMNAESRTIALRASFRTRDDLRLDFLPQHLRDFLFETASAQTLYDRARIEAVRIKTEMMEVEARKARERAARRQRFMQLGQTSSSLDQSRPDEDLSLLSQEETHLLKSLLEEVVGLNESIDAAYEKLENAKGAEEGEMGTAADMAERAQKQLEDALYRMKMFRRQLLSERVRPIRHALPPHLRNIMSANFPMLQLWREGLTELPVCEAINGMETLDAKIGEAKRLVDDLEAGRVGPEREAEAMELLQGAIALGVAVKEKALASMLDKSIGGQQLKLRRFPRHVQNLIVAEEPVLVLWEKGVIDPQICKWLDTLSDILRMYRKSRELGSQLEGLGESEGAALSRQIDELQHKADERVSGLREEVARGVSQGVLKSRLPPHLLILLKDHRPGAFLFREGKLDPTMAIYERHVKKLMKERKLTAELRWRARRMLDQQNRLSSIRDAEERDQRALAELLRIRAKIYMGLMQVSELSHTLRSAIGRVEEEMEDGTISEEMFDVALSGLGIPRELINRLRKSTLRHKQRVLRRADVEWEESLGLPAALLPPPAGEVPSQGVDTTRIRKQEREDSLLSEGFRAEVGMELSLPAAVQWIEFLEGAEVPEGFTQFPVLDDVHPKSAAEGAVVEEHTDDEGPSDAGMTETDVQDLEDEGPYKIRKKVYDSDDDDMPDRLPKREKKKTNAKGVMVDEERLQGKTRLGIPIETRRLITERVVEGKITLKIDISGLDLPYIPKQVLDCLHVEYLIADRNLLDEIDPLMGRMQRLKFLSLSNNRIESPIPVSLWELNVLKTLQLDHNQLDDIPPEIEQLSSLTKLRLDCNNLEAIPESLGTRTTLKYLSVDQNNLSDIPSSFKSANSLATLTLSRNAFSFIPECVFSMASLKTLHFHHNRIPEVPQLIEKLKKLADINFGANLLTEVPPALSKLVNLEKVDFSKNEIKTLQPGIRRLTKLKTLSLAHNLFLQLPEELSACILLQKLSINANRIQFLPVDITRLAQLQVLDLRDNVFTALAPQLGRMSSIVDLRVEGNDVKTPPAYICDLGTKAMLRFLDRIDTAMSTATLDLTNLSVPPDRVLVQKGFTKGRKTVKDKFKVVPEVPVFLRTFEFPHGDWTGMGEMRREQLRVLNLANNGMKSLLGYELSGDASQCLVPHALHLGRVPDWAWQLDPLSQLQELRLEGNRLPSLPSELRFLTSLTFLDISNNSIEELDGESLGMLTNLTHLNLRNNPKVRRIPDEVGLFASLSFLDVINCLLWSPPPVVVQRGCRPIVEYLGKLLQARREFVLDVRKINLLAVPLDISEKYMITDLCLASNHLTVLPPAMGNMTGLRRLRLDHNHLGLLPDCLTSLVNLREIGANYNMLRQVLETEEKILSFPRLQVCEFSNNLIHRIPVALCCLCELEVLDLSCNSLSTLPLEMCRLTNLTRLNLKKNILRTPLFDLTLTDDIGVLLEFLRTCLNARGGEGEGAGAGAGAGAVQHGTRWLDLSHRPYKLLPAEVLSITSLTTLKLRNMGMEMLYEGISVLCQLMLVDLSDNFLDALPDSFAALTCLRSLLLSNNFFKRIPYSIGALRLLEVLELEHNQLTVIFSDIQNLTSLSELNLSHNCLRQITTNMTSLCCLKTLDLSDNQINFLPPVLSRMTHVGRLSLRSNFITELPSELHALARGSLVALDVEDNGLRSPPPEVQAQGLFAMLEYLFRFHRARETGALDLSDLNITYVSADVMQFASAAGRKAGLQTLILDGNSISTLPSYLRGLTSLTHLSLQGCSMTRLPYWLGDLQLLLRLDLEGNNIVSPPPEILTRGVSAIVGYMREMDSAWWTRELDISGQRFTAVPLEVCEIDSLTSLSLHSQSFDFIPENIGRLTSLTLLNLQHCSLVELPDGIGLLRSLKELILNNNRLIFLPHHIGSCTNLTHLRLHENLLEDLPKAIGRLTLMQDLRLFNNNILQLPVELGFMKFLPSFRISSNQLASLPIGIGGLESVTDLLLSDNFLESLPPQIGLLTSITRLRASSNRLQELPDELGNLWSMTELGVSNNQLTQLPPLGHLTALRTLLVSNNPLQFPPEKVVRKGTMAMVNYLKVFHDAGGAPMELVERGEESVFSFHALVKQGVASGTLSLRAKLLLEVPEMLAEHLPKMEHLNLESNRICELPPQLVTCMTNLRSLNVSYNQISWISEEVSLLTRLEVLDAKYNSLTAFPSSLANLHLRRLFLNSNELRSLPDSISSLRSLLVFSAANNTIRDIAGAAFRGLTGLEELYLQQNELRELPDMFQDLQILRVLDLSFNHLFLLPASISRATSLSSLSLAYNDLETSSLVFDLLLRLEHLNLTSNRLSGIPHTFVNLKLLASLLLDGNLFELDASSRSLRTWETTQRWLRMNHAVWARANAEQQTSFLLRRERREKRS